MMESDPYLGVYEEQLMKAQETIIDDERKDKKILKDELLQRRDVGRQGETTLY